MSFSQEKPQAHPLPPRRVSGWAPLSPPLVAIIIAAAVFGTVRYFYRGVQHDSPHSQHDSALCPQTDPLSPVKHAELYKQIGAVIETNEYKLRAVEWLAGAVKIPTESFDEMNPVGQDPRWEAFAPFHDYLFKAFPLIHQRLSLTKVNTYGLVYHWQGSNATLKPLLLTAHQDVVPVDQTTVGQWIHPPYSGHFDGIYVWGRGSSDDKSGLISAMSAVETLLEKGFQPTRTVVLAFGFDEEASGDEGAGKIAEYLLEQYGANSFALLVDEGGGWSRAFGSIVAVPAIAEKGYLDVHVKVDTPGGHSSVPPPHTSIGILSSLLVTLETHPHVSHISRTSPTYGTLQCLAENTPDMPPKLRKNIKDSVNCDRALRHLEDYLFSRDPITKATVGTTQAIDIISGGIKANALPEQAVAVVNHRIAADSSVDMLQERLTNLFTTLASKFNLSFTSFGQNLTLDGGPRYGSLELADTWNTALEPAPISPTDSAAFKLLSGTIKHSILDPASLLTSNSNVVIAPGISTGNTDTKSYWKLTPNIVRYSHHDANDTYAGVHTVNEAIKISGILGEIKFFTALILNSDESTVM